MDKFLCSGILETIASYLSLKDLNKKNDLLLYKNNLSFEDAVYLEKANVCNLTKGDDWISIYGESNEKEKFNPIGIISNNGRKKYKTCSYVQNISYFIDKNINGIMSHKEYRFRMLVAIERKKYYDAIVNDTFTKFTRPLIKWKVKSHVCKNQGFYALKPSIVKTIANYLTCEEARNTNTHKFHVIEPQPENCCKGDSEIKDAWFEDFAYVNYVYLPKKMKKKYFSNAAHYCYHLERGFRIKNNATMTKAAQSYDFYVIYGNRFG
jgi:hypothetical protein